MSCLRNAKDFSLTIMKPIGREELLSTTSTRSLVSLSGMWKRPIFDVLNFLGECDDPFGNIAEGVYDAKDYYIEVNVTSDSSSGLRPWNVDLIKFYFMGIGYQQKIIYCHPGNGNGKWFTSERVGTLR